MFAKRKKQKNCFPNLCYLYHFSFSFVFGFIFCFSRGRILIYTIFHFFYHCKCIFRPCLIHFAGRLLMFESLYLPIYRFNFSFYFLFTSFGCLFFHSFLLLHVFSISFDFIFYYFCKFNCLCFVAFYRKNKVEE